MKRHRSLIALSHDHHHGLALALRCRKQALGQLKPVDSAGLKARAEEASRFVEDHLAAHFRAEEEILFPAMSQTVPESRPLIARLLQEHDEIRAGASRLAKGSGLSKLLFDLGDLLERHIRCEERELFPLFERRVPAADAAKVGQELARLLPVRDRR